MGSSRAGNTVCDDPGHGSFVWQPANALASDVKGGGAGIGTVAKTGPVQAEHAEADKHAVKTGYSMFQTRGSPTSASSALERVAAIAIQDSLGL